MDDELSIMYKISIAVTGPLLTAPPAVVLPPDAVLAPVDWVTFVPPVPIAPPLVMVPPVALPVLAVVPPLLSCQRWPLRQLRTPCHPNHYQQDRCHPRCWSHPSDWFRRCWRPCHRLHPASLHESTLVEPEYVSATYRGRERKRKKRQIGSHRSKSPVNRYFLRRQREACDGSVRFFG